MSNKYTYSAPYTEQELFNLYITKNMSQTEIGNMFGISQHKVFKDLKRMGINSRKAIKRNQFGENNSSWKGGRILVGSYTQDGHIIESHKGKPKSYYMVLCRNHPNANKEGYVFEHIKIALENAGRNSLDAINECVHHVNCVKTDNKPDNLVICTKDKHREYHSKLEVIIGELICKGMIGFDSELGYFIK
jgi:hypothetical protein